jgi:hypothetical protein
VDGPTTANGVIDGSSDAEVALGHGSALRSTA